MTKATETGPLQAPDDQDARLPHDRDEHAAPVHEDAQHRKNRAPIDQALADVESGLQDTERIGTPSDVPSSARNRGSGR